MTSKQVDLDLGQFYCDLRPGGQLRTLERAEDIQGVDWAALIAELRAARQADRLDT